MWRNVLWSNPRLATLLCVFTICGCRRGNDPSQYIPAQSIARRALEMALTARKEGRTESSLPLDGKISVEVIDKYRRPGQKLNDFKVLGEVSVNGGRWFEVELNFDEPVQSEQVRYCVLGINPLWVFAQADYEQIAHWDHPMGDHPAVTPTQAAAPPQTPPKSP